MRYQSEFLRTMAERGFIHQMSDAEGLDALMARECVTAYIGFDATAPSLHAGSMTQIMLLHWLQRTGHRPIALMGGGHDDDRRPVGPRRDAPHPHPADIEANKASIRRAFEGALTFGDGPTDAIMADNADWLLDLNLVAFLRDYGRHFSVNQMLARDSVKNRLGREQHLSFLEFNYMVLQAYDFVELARRYDCRLQLGGSDQWGNIVSGVDLGRRAGTPDLYAFTSPLLETASGAKMGKTADGAVWLNPDMLLPFEFWQYWRNVEDDDVGRFLKLFTTLPMDEVARLEALEGAEINWAKAVLATEATALIHGREEAERAAAAAATTFGAGQSSDDLPTIEVPRDEFEAGIGMLALFVRAGLAGSNAEARRQAKGGALRIDGEPQSDERRTITDADLSDGTVRLSMGKKKHVLVRAV